MKSLLSRARTALALLLCVPAWAMASPHYETIGGIGIQQTGLTITDLGNGTKRWVTSLTWTNNNAFSTNTLYFELLNQWVQGSPSNATAMQWNDTSGVFETGNLVADADNEAQYIALNDTNIGPVNPIFGVSATDRLPAFLIGSLGIGQSVSTQVNFLMSAAVHTMYFNGAIIQAVPEPQTAAVVLLGLAAVAMSRRRRAGR